MTGYLFKVKDKLGQYVSGSIAGLAFCILWLCPCLKASAQNNISAREVHALNDSLQEVIIQAYESNRDRMQVAMPVAVIREKDMENFNPQSAVQAINAIAGVHMDERSPASYRLNIRGSSMRSPFGVRNVKVYYNDLPYTEPGGTSYLNQLGPLHFSGAEIVKGPGSSMYGSGTGGVVLLGNDKPSGTGFTAGYAFGSYNTHSLFAEARVVSDKSLQQIMYQQNKSDGYRDQSASNRKVFNWIGRYHLGNHYELSHTVLFGDLYYQTPGALTLKEYLADPQAARPASGGFPSAKDAQAAIWQKTLISGFTLKSRWGNGLSNKASLYTAFTRLDNAAIRNYSFVKQPHSGGRSVFSFVKNISDAALKLDAGAEFQSGSSGSKVYDNNLGSAGAPQSISSVSSTQWFVFLQAALSWGGWELLMGSSLNNISLKYDIEEPALQPPATRTFANILSPRVSLSRSLNKNTFLYTAISKGFSPPVTDELMPSGSAFNPQLQPEQGVNYEIGFRYRMPQKLMLELNGYYFRLDQTIVQRRDAGGGDYYINAGNTLQPGIELNAIWTAGDKEKVAWQVNASYAYQPYTYGNFKREQNDYSGNALPGLSAHNVYLGLHAGFLKHFILQVNYYYNSRVALNDLNSEYGNEVHALSGRVGYQVQYGNYSMKLFAGAENILDKAYSLGYDINAAAGRYYNAAPGRNYFCQVIFAR